MPSAPCATIGGIDMLFTFTESSFYCTRCVGEIERFFTKGLIWRGGMRLPPAGIEPAHMV